MALGERMKAYRQQAGLSQEKVAELVGVSRQAVTKWETNQSAPNTQNLCKLAEIFDITVDALLENNKQSPAEELYSLYKREKEKALAERRNKRKKNIAAALLITGGYLAVYLMGRLLWCVSSETSLMGWLISAKPAGDKSYLYGWLLSSQLFWIAMAISVAPTLFGKYKFSFVTLAAFIIGLVAGILFGPNHQGAAYGQGDYGWAIWGGIFLLSIVMGILFERLTKEDAALPSKKMSIWGILALAGIVAIICLVRISIPQISGN